MIFRTATEKEKRQIYRTEYDYWGLNTDFNDYAKDNEQEEKNGGLRFVLADDHKIYGSLIATTFSNLPKLNIPLYGIGSVIVPPEERGKGYGVKMLKECIAFHHREHPENVAMLYSDIDPHFYERLGFKQLPIKYQLNEKSICMIHCDQHTYEQISPYVTRYGLEG